MITETMAQVMARLKSLPRLSDEEYSKKLKEREVAAAVERSAKYRYLSGVEQQLFQSDVNRAGPWEAARSKLCSKIGTGLLCALTGIRGNGKTQLGVELIRESAGRFMSCKMLTATRLMMRIKDANERGAREETIDRYVAYRVLVIDEFEKGVSTGFENSMFFELLNARFSKLDKRDTLLIGNETSIEQFNRVAGDSLVSRINSRDGVFLCNWPSFRKARP